LFLISSGQAGYSFPGVYLLKNRIKKIMHEFIPFWVFELNLRKKIRNRAGYGCGKTITLSRYPYDLLMYQPV
jgi:hypothetical protein